MHAFLTPLRIGILITLAAIALAWYVLETGDTPITGGQSYTVSALFDNAMGIVPKSRVLIAGIPVGEIEDVDLDGGRARVYMRIHEKIVLYEDAAVRKVQESMLGTSLLEISPGTPGKRKLEDGSIIQTIPSAPSMGEMMDQLNDISMDMKAITGALREMMVDDDPEKASIKTLIDNLNKATSALNDTIGLNTANVNAIMQNTRQLSGNLVGISESSRGEIQLILADIRDVASSLKTIASRQGERVDGAMDDIDGILAKLDKNIDKLDTAMDNATEITEKVNSGEGAIGTLLNDKDVAEDIKKVSKTAGDYADRINRLQFWFHVQSDFYYNQLAAKTAVSLKLLPRKDKFYMLSIIDDPRGRTRRYRTLTKTTDSNRDAFIREDRTETSYGFKVSLLYGQRFDFATFRFGLIENSGGLGLDLEFFKDILKFRNDIYEFATNEPYPRIKSQINVEIWRHIFLSGGVDDIINGRTRDYFFGAGIMFEDEDIKTLFGAGGASAAGSLAGQ